MKKLKKIHKNVFRHEFTEQEMRAYFTQNNTKKKAIIVVSLVLSPVCFFSGFWLTQYYLAFYCAFIIFSAISLITWMTIQFGIHPPTDKEYDTWVQQ